MAQPVGLPQLMHSLVDRAVDRALVRTVGPFLHPGVPEKIGFSVGALILVLGYGRMARAARLKRIERKLDEALA